ncbi:TetR/AcrR family transcriptional regulator [Actinokineospora auranticolor]|uniref:DNA-binding transcriptional regulator YbjK n=1 Tax=Actinokineospora auranticolor TaxID=155976 RepID=A0A2S6GIZ2_9PSEU|nr:TetR/AcrR family transcriptional regulator [Actinokineospora auranticolor]PPK65208.1 DNA-binding transcriptional regulator YbjK [Actinokineospora auranticolor]
MAGVTAADRGREVRQRLVAAATELIVERGWSAVSTRVLAERAAVAPGLVHYHFSSLRSLLTEAAVAAMREAAQVVDPLLARAGTPEDAVDLLVGAFAEYTGDEPVSLLFTETYLAATRDEELRRAVAGVAAEVGDRLAVWLGERGVADPGPTAAVLIAAIDGLLLHRALNPSLTADAVAPVLRRLCAGPEPRRSGP